MCNSEVTWRYINITCTVASNININAFPWSPVQLDDGLIQRRTPDRFWFPVSNIWCVWRILIGSGSLYWRLLWNGGRMFTCVIEDAATAHWKHFTRILSTLEQFNSLVICNFRWKFPNPQRHKTEYYDQPISKGWRNVSCVSSRRGSRWPEGKISRTLKKPVSVYLE
jgi:hypothetical protein